MVYFLLALEGFLTFISPCLLPMIPIYVAYLVGEQKDEQISEAARRRHMLRQALSFVLGFTLVFIALSLFVSTIGRFVLINQFWINLFVGGWLILLGIDYLLRSPIMNWMNQRLHLRRSYTHNGNSLLLGIVFAISWTPCVGTFLTSALAHSATASHPLEGALMLLAYSVGLGIPFILTAVLLDSFQSTFDWLKRNSRSIQIVGGLLLIMMGIFTMTGHMASLLTFLS